MQKKYDTNANLDRNLGVLVNNVLICSDIVSL